jgi:DNA-binding FadR family transcriptional regulator
MTLLRDPALAELVQPLYRKNQPTCRTPVPIAMPLQAVEPRRLYRHIADQIRDLIASGEFSRGARLPAERDIAAQLGVSRTSVREALIALEIGGLVEVRGGSGIYVTASAGLAQPLFEHADAGAGPFELLRARRLVEGEVAALAAETIDAARLALLEQSVVALENAHDTATRDQADRLFHLHIVEATHNSVLVQTVRLYWDLRRGPLWKRAADHFHTPRLLRQVIADHRELIRALAAHDGAAARAAMHQHLDRVAKHFARSWNEAAHSSDTPQAKEATP